MKGKLSLLVAAALAAEMGFAGAATAVPLRADKATAEPAPLATTVNHRRHHWRGRGGGDAAAAIIGGLAAGAIIGGLARPRYYDDYYYGGYYEPRVYYQPRVYYRSGGGLGAHQQWCLNRWRSYDVRSDTYQPYNGPRRYCNSPYN